MGSGTAPTEPPTSHSFHSRLHSAYMARISSHIPLTHNQQPFHDTSLSPDSRFGALESQEMEGKQCKFQRALPESASAMIKFPDSLGVAMRNLGQQVRIEPDPICDCFLRCALDFVSRLKGTISSSIKSKSVMLSQTHP